MPPSAVWCRCAMDDPLSMDARPLLHERTRRVASAGDLPPGPSVAPLVQVLRWLRQPLPFLDDCARRYGDSFTVRLAGGPPLVLFSHPDAVRQIISGDPDQFRAGEANRTLAPVLGQHSLLLLDGLRHRHARRLMLPPFHGERLHAYGALIAAVADRAIDRWPLGRAFPVHVAMQEISLDVILRVVLGDDDEAMSARLRGLVLDLLALTAQPFVRMPWAGGQPREMKRWTRIARVRKQIDALLRAYIAERRAGTSSGRDGLLDVLLETRDENGQPLADVELCDELVTLLVAGHETTATALAWTFHHLLAEPSLLARLYADISASSGDSPYLDATIKETLRLRPVFAVVGRLLARPATIGGGHLPAGVIAAPCIYLTHRRPDVWREPERFDPARFLGSQPTPYEFLPFGGGARRCLGMAFALFEMKLIIARVLARTRLRPAGVTVQSVRRNVTFAPAGGVPVVVDALVA